MISSFSYRSPPSTTIVCTLKKSVIAATIAHAMSSVHKSLTSAENLPLLRRRFVLRFRAM